MTFMSDEAIEAAKSQPCPCCAAGIGDECENPVTGIPLLEDVGRPVHVRRLEP